MQIILLLFLSLFIVANVSPAATNKHTNTATPSLSALLQPPLKCIYAQSRGVLLTYFIIFMLNLLDTCHFLLSDLSASINWAAASVQDDGLALAWASDS